MYCLGAMGMKEEIAMDQGVKWLQLAAAHPDDDDGADALQMLSIWQESLLIPGIRSFHCIAAAALGFHCIAATVLLSLHCCYCVAVAALLLLCCCCRVPI